MHAYTTRGPNGGTWSSRWPRGILVLSSSNFAKLEKKEEGNEMKRNASARDEDRVDASGYAKCDVRFTSPRVAIKTSLESRYSHARIASTLYAALRVETDAKTRR